MPSNYIKNQAPNGKVQFFDNNGDPLSGGTLTIYNEGTTILSTVYADAIGTALVNPVALDSRGEASVFLDSGKYKYLLRDSEGVEIYTIDGIQSIEDLRFADGESILDNFCNELLTFGVVEDAVNNVKISNAITGEDPKIEAIGDDTDVDLNIGAQGAGVINMCTSITFQDLDGILDDSKNETLIFGKSTDAVNYVKMTNAATGLAPKMEVLGDDTDVSLEVAAKGAGTINLTADTGNTPEVRMSEDDTNGSEYIGLKAPASIAASFTLTLPDADGSDGSFLTTDGAGITAFSTINDIDTAAAVVGSDYLMIYDVDAGLNKKATVSDVLAAATDAFAASVNQVAHGLSVGNWIYIDSSGDYQQALGDDATTSDVLGRVSAVADVDNFTYQLNGALASGFTGLTPGDILYLDVSTAGDDTTTDPEVSPGTAGHVRKVLAIALSATTARIQIQSGKIIN